jgi:hypothetical protein
MKKEEKEHLKEKLMDMMGSQYFTATAAQCLLKIAKKNDHLKIFFIDYFKQHFIAQYFRLVDNEEIIVLAYIYSKIRVFK